MKYKLFCLLVSAIVLVGVGCGGRSPERGYAGKYLIPEIFWNLEQDGTFKYYEYETGRWVEEGNWKEWKEGERSGIDMYGENEILRLEYLGQGIFFAKLDASLFYVCYLELGERDPSKGYAGIYGQSLEQISINEDGTYSIDDTVIGKWKVWEGDGKKGMDMSPEGEETVRLEDLGQGILRFEAPESPIGYFYFFRIEPEMIEAAFAIKAEGCSVALEQDEDASQLITEDFDLYDLQGEEIVILSELLGKGNKVVLAFWTTWCPACVQSVPAMREFYREHGDEVSLVSINIREGDSAVKRFADENELGFRIAMDRDGSVARKFNVVGVPTYIVLKPDGERLYQGHDFGSAVLEAGF